MSLGHLALIVAAGLASPLFAASRRAFVPVVAGEIAAGVLLGRSGLDVVRAATRRCRSWQRPASPC